MILTLTGLDLTRKKDGRVTRATAGYAYVGGACVRNTYLKKISSVALVEDSGGYSGVIVAAHEIGHLLGAVHDGDAAPSYLRGPGAKSCSWSDGFIMSDLRRSSRGLSWSQCSVKQMKYFLSTSTAACLYNSPQSSDFSLPGDDDLPGFSTSLDDQCRQDRGTRACYKDQRVCSQLFCYTSNYSGCYAFRPAAEGSECGRNKICINGKCVKRKKVISTNNEPSDTILGIVMEEQVNDDHDENVTDSSTTTTVITTTTTEESYKAITTTTIKTDAISDDHTRMITKKQSKSSSKKNIKKSKNTFIPRKPKQNQVSAKDTKILSDDCEDSLKVLGSLTCEQLFQRYAFHYCKNNRVIKKKCCISYQKFCIRNYP